METKRKEKRKDTVPGVTATHPRCYPSQLREVTLGSAGLRTGGGGEVALRRTLCPFLCVAEG